MLSDLQLLTAEGHLRRPTSDDIKSGVFPVEVTPKVISVKNDEDFFYPNTATFRFSPFEDIEKVMIGAAAVTLTLRWESSVGLPLSREEFRALCMAQANFFNAQLLNQGVDGRVGSFDIACRMKPDTIDTYRHCVPLSYFETVALGGKPSPYGVLIDL